MGLCANYATICKKDAHIIMPNTDFQIDNNRNIKHNRNDVFCSCSTKNDLRELPIHNNINISKECHIKLCVDKGRVVKINEGSKIDDVIIKEHSKQFEDKKNINKQKFEDKKIDLRVRTVREIASNSVFKRRMTFAEFGGFLMQREIIINVKPFEVPIISFDPSNLILEKEGMITDTYKIMETLGRGSFGEVRKIVHLSSKRVYAMKIINKSNYSGIEDIINEIEVLKSLVLVLIIIIGPSNYSSSS